MANSKGTTKTFTADATGSVFADIVSHIGHVTVTADPNLRNAQITVSTGDTEGPVADAVNNTQIKESRLTSGHRVTVEVPELPGGGGSSISINGSTIQVSGNYGVVRGNVTGMVMSGGDVWVGGRQILRGGRVVAEAGTQVLGAGAAGTITVELRLPAESSVRLATTSADLVHDRGDLTVLDVHSVSGDVATRGTVHDLLVGTTSGDVDAQNVTARVDITSVSGDVDIADYEGTVFRVQSVSGDVDVTATRRADGQMSVSTVSGDVTTRGADHIGPRVTTVSGRHRRR